MEDWVHAAQSEDHREWTGRHAGCALGALRFEVQCALHASAECGEAGKLVTMAAMKRTGVSVTKKKFGMCLELLGSSRASAMHLAMTRRDDVLPSYCS